MPANPHTKYDPTTAEFCCPRCGAPSGTFYIDNAADCTLEECELLHKKDQLGCFGCGYSTTGAAFVKQLLKAKNLVPCPCCKGSGVVPKEPA